jgi:hypothetical protein
LNRIYSLLLGESHTCGFNKNGGIKAATSLELSDEAYRYEDFTQILQENGI